MARMDGWMEKAGPCEHVTDGRGHAPNESQPPVLLQFL